MAKTLYRLAFLIAMLAVLDITRKDVVYAVESRCDCSCSGGGGAFIYLDDWTFVNQTTGSDWTYIQPSGTPYGAYYCEQFCISYSNYLMGGLCASYGSGHKTTALCSWTYDDPQNLYGGSGNGGWNRGPFECS